MTLTIDATSQQQAEEAIVTLTRFSELPVGLSVKRVVSLMVESGWFDDADWQAVSEEVRPVREKLFALLTRDPFDLTMKYVFRRAYLKAVIARIRSKFNIPESIPNVR